MDQEDNFLEDLKEQAGKIIVLTQAGVLHNLRSSGQIITRDAIAIGQGTQTPPHLQVLSEVFALMEPFYASKQLGGLARKAGSHLTRQQRRVKRSNEVGTNIFIGHGSSSMWMELKDFIKDRLHLPWDEFNRVPVAGITNIARLSEMLDSAAIAFLIMTGEDEQADGKVNARMNVVHEAGLFQGRLGFTRSIILLEEGCEEFSNIEGLGQIRFSKGNIKGAFEEVRKVLEREEILEP
ncbi:MAG: hypothetical protein HOH38_04950 [Nitrospinaceae bacterium]|nr:hypothetical protein [Nitrospinaceae bacterium]